ncbi:hypothetical protein Tco_1385623 [Tanacetum coccineum]
MHKLNIYFITRVLFILPRTNALSKFSPDTELVLYPLQDKLTSGDKTLDLSAFKLSRLFFSLLMTIDTNVTTPVNVTGVPVTNTVANHVEKPKKFNGQNFKRWQQKMFFYLTTLNLARFLKETAPQGKPSREGQPSNVQAVQAVKAWKHSDFVCHNYVLSGLVDSLYNVYCKTMTAKELWSHWNPGHRTDNCKMPKRVTPHQANMVNDNMDMIAMVSDFITMISEVNLVVNNGEKLYMGNSATTDIKGKEDVILKMTSEKELKLTYRRLTRECCFRCSHESAASDVNVSLKTIARNSVSTDPRS